MPDAKAGSSGRARRNTACSGRRPEVPMIEHLFPGKPSMVFARASVAVALVGSAFPALGCLDEPTLTASSLSQNALSQNAFSLNALNQNALTASPLPQTRFPQTAFPQNPLNQTALTATAPRANAPPANALPANALTANALTAGALADPLARELLKYIVSCALPADAEIDLTV